MPASQTRIGIGRLAGVASGIDVGTIIRRGYDEHTIPVNIDVARTRLSPVEPRGSYSLSFVLPVLSFDRRQTGLALAQYRPPWLR